MELFTAKSQIAFMRIRRYTFALSIVSLIGCTILIAWLGINLSLDYTGGVQLQIEASTSANDNVDSIRQQLANAGLNGSKVQAIGKTLTIRHKAQADTDTQHLTQQIKTALPTVNIISQTTIGPQIGEALILDGISALVGAMIATMIYIALRFEWKFAVSAIISLIHDPIITLGIFALFQVEFDLMSLTALLTILGYSLNDTVIVYDRIREKHHDQPNGNTESLINQAINETLSRTIITSGLTFLAVLALCLFGGDSLWGFSLAFAIGIVVGTYSSIYVAGALALELGLDLKQLSQGETTV